MYLDKFQLLFSSCSKRGTAGICDDFLLYFILHFIYFEYNVKGANFILSLEITKITKLFLIIPLFFVLVFLPYIFFLNLSSFLP